MARNRWPTFGYDSARANAHIGRQTGKWGRLKTPDEVWDYMEKYMPDGQANMFNQPAPEATRSPQEPPKPKCNFSTGRVVLIANGKAQLCAADEYGNPTKVLEEKPATGNGKAYKCSNCSEAFQEWAKFVEHCLAKSQSTAVL